MSTPQDDPINEATPPTPSMADRREMLIDSWFDGTLADDQFAELETSLLESGEARQEFWDRATAHGLLREAARIRFAAFTVPDNRNSIVAEAPAKHASSPGRSCRDRIAAKTRWLAPAAAWLFAVLVTSTGVAYAHRWATMAPSRLIIHREGFENPPPPHQDFQPSQRDIWGGDETEVVGSQDGIVPHGGSRMLRFVSNHPRNAHGFGAIGEIWRFVDLTALRAANGGRLGRIELSAFFNAARSGDTVKPYGGVSLVAMDAPPGKFSLDWSWFAAETASRPAFMATTQVRQELDGDRASWQLVTASIMPPEGARYLVLRCFAERWRDDGERLPFESMGHYVDDIRLDIVPEAAD